MASLDRWFSSKSVEVPSFFYQNWSLIGEPKMLSPAVWLNQAPKLVNFRRKVIWPEMRKEIIICGYVPLKTVCAEAEAEAEAEAKETEAEEAEAEAEEAEKAEEAEDAEKAEEVEEAEKAEENKKFEAIEKPEAEVDAESALCDAKISDWADLVRIPSELKYQNVGMLKSHLQKCLRRQVTEPAVQSAYHLFKMEPEALFRRLTIIMLEDVYLLEAYGTLVWLTLARQDPRFQWTLPMIHWTLSLIRQLSEFAYFDNAEPPARSRFNFQNNLSKIQKKIPANQQALLYAMKIRRDLVDSMPGEQFLQDQKIHLWFIRFSSNDSQKYQKLVYQPLIWTDKIPAPLKLKEWILPGIDFHCSPMIVDWTIQKFPELTPKEVKDAIWHKRSSLNTRVYLEPKAEIAPETEAVWRKIRTSIENSSFYILKHFH